MKDNTTSGVNDTSYINNRGTKVGSNNPLQTNGKIGEAQTFFGNGSYITSADSSSWYLQDNWTISFWVYRNATTNQFPILMGQGIDVTNPISWAIFYYENTNDNVWFSYYPAGTTASRLNYDTGWALPTSSWNYLTFVRNGTTLNFYVNGTKIGTHYIGTNATPDINSAFTMGSINPFTANYNFNGSLDEVRIDNQSREIEWLKANYNMTMYPALFVYNVSVAVNDTTSPTYSGNSTNNTIVSLSTNFSLLANDNTALHPNGYYIFSTNNTGTWTNDSAVNFTTTPTLINVTKTLNTSVGISIGFRWYLFDNVNNTNVTEIFNLITTAEIADTSFTVAIANGSTQINFTANNKTISNLNALGQSETTPIINITNTGDVGLDIYLVMNQTESGFNLSSSLTNDYISSNIKNTTSNEIRFFMKAENGEKFF
jgi:hypothetical protein